MRKILIQDKLNELGVSLNDISLGDFDYIGEYTAKKVRDKNSELYHKVGSVFRPNYERGILIHSLITKFKLQSYLEVGFGRGFSALCAAKALCEIGSPGKVITVDPVVDEQQLKIIQATMPKEWIEKIEFKKGMSQQALPQVLSENSSFDFIYVDGDHRAAAVQADWEMVKGHWTRFCLFDDYHFPTKTSDTKDIEVASVIDKIDWEQHHASAEVVILDRRIFFDDRRISDQDIDYGQVLVTKRYVEPTTLVNDEW